MQYGSSPWTVLNVMLHFNCFFLAQWEEYHTGVLNINNGTFGLTEGQLAQMIMMLSVAVLGPEAWTTPVPGLPGVVEARHFALAPMGATMCLLAAQTVWRALVSVKQRNLASAADRGSKELGPLAAVAQLLPQYAIFAAGYWLTFAPHFKEETLLVFLCWGSSCSFYTTVVIVSQMSKSPIPWGRALLTIAAPAVLASAHLNGAFRIGGLSDAAVARAWAVGLGVQYLYYVVGVCSDLASHLNIRVFSIPAPKAQ